MGIPRGLEKERPPYARVLGLGPKGEEILSAVKNAPVARVIPLVSRPGRIETLGEAARQIWRLENRAADLYALALPEPYPAERNTPPASSGWSKGPFRLVPSSWIPRRWPQIRTASAVSTADAVFLRNGSRPAVPAASVSFSF